MFINTAENRTSKLNGLIIQYLCHFAASSLSEIEAASSSVSEIDEYRPKLVRTINRRRFDRALRTIHELCQWGAKEGIKMLTNIHKVLVHVLTEWKYVINLENPEH